MSKALSPEQIASYRENGYVFPIDILGEAEAAELRRKFHELEAREGGQLSRRTNTRVHLLVTWLNDLIRDPRSADPRSDRGSDRPKHSLLGLGLLRQTSRRWDIRQLASGWGLLEHALS